LNLKRLFVIHALVTFVAGAVLIVAPELIPAAVGISIDPSAYLVCYLLGAAEIAVAFLSYYAKNLTDPPGLRLITLTFVVFHAVTAIVEIFAFMQGLSAAIWSNVALRVVAVILFTYYGLRQPSKDR
jgi:hypothetical protein